jgi:predicted MFS family arabinose efflux permease
VPIGLTRAVVHIGGGVLVDHGTLRFLLSGALVGRAASLVMAPRPHHTVITLVHGMVLGIMSSLQLTVNAVVWAKYLGWRHFGSITGTASLVLIAGSVLGPMPMGIPRDVLGKCSLVLTAAAAPLLALAIAALPVRRPYKTHELCDGDGPE